MEWTGIGQRIRRQREYLGYTREQIAEMLDVTPKFCSDIDLGVKGMSVPTLCNISKILRLRTDYILFGDEEVERTDADLLLELLKGCSDNERIYAEQLLKTFLLAMNSKGEPQ